MRGGPLIIIVLFLCSGALAARRSCSRLRQIDGDAIAPISDERLLEAVRHLVFHHPEVITPSGEKLQADISRSLSDAIAEKLGERLSGKEFYKVVEAHFGDWPTAYFLAGVDTSPGPTTGPMTKGEVDRCLSYLVQCAGRVNLNLLQKNRRYFEELMREALPYRPPRSLSIYRLVESATRIYGKFSEAVRESASAAPSTSLDPSFPDMQKIWETYAGFRQQNPARRVAIARALRDRLMSDGIHPNDLIPDRERTEALARSLTRKLAFEVSPDDVRAAARTMSHRVRER